LKRWDSPFIGSLIKEVFCKSKAKQVRQQRGLPFDDISFMTAGRYLQKKSSSPQTKKGRIEYSRNYNPSKRGRFKGIHHADGSYGDLD